MLILSSDKNMPDPLKQKYAYIIEDDEKEIPKNKYLNRVFVL